MLMYASGVICCHWFALFESLTNLKNEFHRFCMHTRDYQETFDFCALSYDAMHKFRSVYKCDLPFSTSDIIWNLCSLIYSLYGRVSGWKQPTECAELNLIFMFRSTFNSHHQLNEVNFRYFWRSWAIITK